MGHGWQDHTVDPGSITPQMRDSVLERFGYAASPTVDRQGLTGLYTAWCRNVPFDNLRKLIALASGGPGPFPGGDATDFFDHWLRDGTGGTCWPSSNALVALLEACGFAVRRVAGSMMETGELSHGSAIVTIDGIDLVVDSSMLSDTPLEVTAEPSSVEHPVHPMAVEPVDDTFRFRYRMTFDPDGTNMFWRLMVDPADLDTYTMRYEASREISPFNDGRVARRNDERGVAMLAKDTLVVRTAGGFETTPVGDADAMDRLLVEVFGFSEQIVARLRALVPGVSISGA